jgi:salicylate hydroxylase
MTTHRNVVVAGGGIGGLAAAIALAETGVTVRVCERREQAPQEGAGIQIGPNGVRILQDLGVAEFLEPHAARPHALIVHEGASARVLARLPLGAWIAARHGAPYWTAHRRDLHAALRARVERDPNIEIAGGSEIVSCTDGPEGAAAVTRQGEAIQAAFVVAADGLWSKLRTEVAGDSARLTPIGKTAFRSVIATTRLPSPLDPEAIHIWLTPSAHAVHYPVSGGRETAIVMISNDAAAPDGWDLPAASDAVKRKAQTFAAPLGDLVASAPEWRQWSLQTLSPLERWSKGSLMLLGDAAHPIQPFLAQGAVMALEDAATLARALEASAHDARLAIAKYESIRRPRVLRAADAALRSGRIYHMKGAAAFARDAALKFTPPERLMASFDWLYGWRIPSS